tara:strand:- start:32 stop:1468 length:1437 start_codon:yes stop_codon:yes gene_type:complete
MQSSHKPQTNTTNKFNKKLNTHELIKESCANLLDYLDNLTNADPDSNAAEHEEMIIKLSNKIGCDALSEMLETYDIDSDVVVVDEQIYRRKHKAKKTYQTAIGPIDIERNVFVNRKKDGDGKSICPLELQAGIISGYWTQTAAQHSSFALAHLTPQEVENLFLKLGQMNPSRSSLDRLPKILMANWEPKIIELHQSLILAEKVPSEAVCISVSFDGVMLGMKPKKKTDDVKNTEETDGCQWKEASCGTISFIDECGDRISTIQYGRMPEHKKVHLKKLLKLNIEEILKQRPDLKVVYLADGAKEIWSYFDEELPHGFQLTDYYHVCQYIKSAFNAAYPDNQDKATDKFNEHKLVLKNEIDGVNSVLRALRYLRSKHPNNKDIKAAVTYFTNNKHRMRYAEAQEKKYPIGSGIVEAACKTLVGQRLKRSGMSWNHHGGQSILTLRSLTRSDRFDRAWNIISKTHFKAVKACNNVVNLFG